MLFVLKCLPDDCSLFLNLLLLRETLKCSHTQRHVEVVSHNLQDTPTV